MKKKEGQINCHSCQTMMQKKKYLYENICICNHFGVFIKDLFILDLIIRQMVDVF